MGHTQLSPPKPGPPHPGGRPKVTRWAPGAPATGDGRSPGRGSGTPHSPARGAGARRGCPCPRRRGWVRQPLAQAVRGARLRARAAESAVQSARACRLARRAARPGSRLPGGAGRRAARAASGRVAWTRLPWQPGRRLSRARARPRGAAPPPSAFPPKIASPAAVSHPARSPATPSRRAGISLIGK